MENFLLILAVVGGIIYKIYENYQEEMEKARKRKTSMPPPTVQPPPQYREETVYTPPQREIIEMPEPVVYEEPKEVVRKTAETSRKDIKKIRNKLDDIRVQTTAQRAHEEAARRLEQDKARRIALQNRSDAEQKPQLEVIDLDSYEFDLENAIIQSAILERPYKD